jgi:ABC-type glycerol-3-phosphate transport system permease component
MCHQRSPRRSYRRGQHLASRQHSGNIDCLNSINKGFLDNAYNDTVNFLGYTIVVTILVCLALCLLIGFSAWRMAAVTHRLVNVGLTIALLVSMVFSFFVVMHLFELSGPHGAYGQMVRDDYDSVYYTAQLKHYGTAANADESRWLIALAFGDQAAADHWQQDWLDNTSRVSMLITRAQANRTWPEEDQPLAAIQTNWNGYFTIDGQIRAAARNTSDPNRIITAERISTGISNQTFGKFSDAVDQLSLANRSHFDQTYASEAANLTLYTTLGLVLFPLIGLLAAWGASRRFKDF